MNKKKPYSFTPRSSITRWDDYDLFKTKYLLDGEEEPSEHLNPRKIDPVNCIFNLVLQREIIEYLWDDKSLGIAYRLKLGLVCRQWFNSISHLFSKDSYFSPRSSATILEYLPHINKPLCPMKYVNSIKGGGVKYDNVCGVPISKKLDYSKLPRIYSTIQNLDVYLYDEYPLDSVRESLSNFVKFSTDYKTPTRAPFKSLDIGTSFYGQGSKPDKHFEVVLTELAPLLGGLESLSIHAVKDVSPLKSQALVTLIHNHPNITSLKLYLRCKDTDYQKALLSSLPKGIKHLDITYSAGLDILSAYDTLESLSFEEIRYSVEYDVVARDAEIIASTIRLMQSTNIKKYGLPCPMPLNNVTQDIFKKCTHIDEFYILLDETSPAPKAPRYCVPITFHAKLKNLKIKCNSPNPLRPTSLLNIKLPEHLQTLTIDEHWHKPVFDMVVAFLRVTKSLVTLHLTELAPRKAKDMVNHSQLMSAIMDNPNNQLSNLRFDHMVTRDNERVFIDFLKHPNTKHLHKVQCQHKNISDSTILDGLNGAYYKLGTFTLFTIPYTHKLLQFQRN